MLDHAYRWLTTLTAMVAAEGAVLCPGSDGLSQKEKGKKGKRRKKGKGKGKRGKGLLSISTPPSATDAAKKILGRKKIRPLEEKNLDEEKNQAFKKRGNVRNVLAV